jgi:uncharacterized membrane protein
MTIKKFAIPIIIYLIGLTFTLSYSLTTDFTSFSDTAREYDLYHNYIYQSFQQTITEYRDEYPLQITCLCTTYVPAQIARLLPKTAEKMCFKIYVSILPPIILVMVYLILLNWFSPITSAIGALFIIWQPLFLQAPSIARQNIAILAFSILIWILTIKTNSKIRNTIIILSSTIMVFAHYTTTIITILTLGGYCTYMLFKRNKTLAVSAILAIVTLIVIGASWYYYASPRFETTTIPAVIYNAFAGAKDNSISWLSLSLRDKLTQVAFGVKNPNNDTLFHFSYTLFAVAWATIIITMLGLTQYRKVPRFILAMSSVGLLTTVSTVVSPALSQTYGVERTFYQASITLAPYFLLGCQKVSNWIRIKPQIVAGLLLIALIILMKEYGVIHSLIQ